MVHRARRFAPLVERGGVKGGERPVRSPPEVDDHTVTVELRVTVATGPVNESGGGNVRGDPFSFAVDHLTGRAAAALDEVQRHGDRLDVGDGCDRRHLGGTEGPQQ